MTTVGTNGGPSAYGAFDMMGNVSEWNDLSGAGGSPIGLRGGDWNTLTTSVLSSSFRYPQSASDDFLDYDFRLARPYSESLPVPSPLPLLGAAAGYGWSRHLRKRIQLVSSPTFASKPS